MNVQVTRTPKAGGGATLAVTLTNPSAAHPPAIAPFRLAAWLRPNADLRPAAAPDGTLLGSNSLLALVDPLGRVGTTTRLVVP